MIDNKTGWTNVTKRNPCPVCQKPDFCRVGTYKIQCMRVSSSEPSKSQIGGWLHALDSKANTAPRPAQTAPRPTVDCAKLMAHYQSTMKPHWLALYAEELGVSVESLERFGVAWCAAKTAWAWPMSDSTGKISGIRLRPKVGKKFCITGSVTGIFLPQMTAPKRLVICEGGTDGAAALTIGLDVLGRPSCMGGVEIIMDYVRRNNVREVVIVADNDPKQRPDGTPWNPGMEGADILQRQLTVRSCIVVPPGKDLRQCVNNGMTRPVFDLLLNGVVWSQPKTCKPAHHWAGCVPERKEK